MPTSRIRASRKLGLWIHGKPIMLCAIAEWHQWRARHFLNAIFLDRRHCAASADWEARQAELEADGDPLADYRREGWL